MSVSDNVSDGHQGAFSIYGFALQATSIRDPLDVLMPAPAQN